MTAPHAPGLPGAPRAGDPGEEPRVPPDPWVRRRLSEVAHEINSPLSAVRLQLFLHRRSLSQASAQDLHSLDVIERNLERIQAMIASLVTVADGHPPRRAS